MHVSMNKTRAQQFLVRIKEFFPWTDLHKIYPWQKPAIFTLLQVLQLFGKLVVTLAWKPLEILPLMFQRAIIWGHFKKVKIGTDRSLLHFYSNKIAEQRNQLKFIHNLWVAHHHSIKRIQIEAVSKSYTHSCTRRKKKKSNPLLLPCSPLQCNTKTESWEMGTTIMKLIDWIIFPGYITTYNWNLIH